MDQGFDQLFRHESGRLVATLTRIFGIHNLLLAEDVVQDAYVRAVEVWKYHGVPDNPAAWLIVTAKRRALDMLRRERTVRTFAAELQQQLESEWTIGQNVEQAFEPKTIKDDLLRMMFTCCHPKLAEEAQIALILNILCGFNVSEVAAAFSLVRQRWRSAFNAPKNCLASQEACFKWPPKAFVRGCRPCSARSIFCSTKATMVPAGKQPSAPTFARKRCISRGFCGRMTLRLRGRPTLCLP
jgi:RNA polymerase sigma factor (sigma-70 family)